MRHLTLGEVVELHRLVITATGVRLEFVISVRSSRPSLSQGPLSVELTSIAV